MSKPFVLDRGLILDRLGGDEEILAMMIDMFLEDVDGNCAALSAAYASGDAATLRREAHTIKGLLSTMSDEDGAAEALWIEQKAKNGEVAHLDTAVEGLLARVRLVASVLRQEAAV
ncbi:MAG: Hpt domain-containing protein [Azonexus sp.]|nr:Hpt domain-containing protein [Azonexus sp.]MCK6412659.1 Hpt domain-containing protein [Azonexus sp.]